MSVSVTDGLRGLDAGWFTTVLRDGGHAEGAVSAVRPEPMAFAGAIGDMVRVRLEYDGPGAPGPETVIAKFRGSTEIQETMDALMGLFQREARFYAELADSVPVASPECYHVGDGGATPLLLSDLGHLRAGDLLTGLAVRDAEPLMDVFADFHVTFWGSPILEEDWVVCPADGEWAELVVQFVGGGIGKLQEACAGRVPHDVLAAAGDVASRWGEVLHRLTEGPKTLAHNDSRLDNIFFGDDGQPVLIDWQNLACTRGVHDIGYLLAASMDAERLRESWEPLLRRYHDRLRAQGIDNYSWEECVLHYRQSVLYPLAAAIALHAQSSDDRGVVIAERMLLHAADLDSFTAV